MAGGRSRAAGAGRWEQGGPPFLRCASRNRTELRHETEHHEAEQRQAWPTLDSRSSTKKCGSSSSSWAWERRTRMPFSSSGASSSRMGARSCGQGRGRGRGQGRGAEGPPVSRPGEHRAARRCRECGNWGASKSRARLRCQPGRCSYVESSCGPPAICHHRIHIQISQPPPHPHKHTHPTHPPTCGPAGRMPS